MPTQVPTGTAACGCALRRSVTWRPPRTSARPAPSAPTCAPAKPWRWRGRRAQVRATADEALVDELGRALEEIVGCRLSGTRHGIGVDPADGLLRAGAATVQLTWMDTVATPRTGKPVEVNALWFNALRAL